MEDYIKDIQDIRTLMETRTRFLSLSGLSGILAGLYALVGAFLGHRIATTSASIPYHDLRNGYLSPTVMKLLALAGVLLLLSVATAYLLSSRKAKQRNESLWNKASLRALRSFALPLGTGGIFGLILISKGFLILIGPITLIFYGLALYAASTYTVRDVASLGMAEVALGLLALAFPGYGLYFWVVGFGVLHILYGSLMYYKYDRTQPSPTA